MPSINSTIIKMLSRFKQKNEDWTDGLWAISHGASLVYEKKKSI